LMILQCTAVLSPGAENDGKTEQQKRCEHKKWNPASHD
jgi:hypothetical protein